VTLAELVLFVPLAILANTALPFSFDPILLGFAGRHAAAGWGFAIIGSICAGVGAVLDAVLLSRLLPGRFRSAAGAGGPGRKWFCVWAALIALTVLPFTTVRVGLLRARPHPLAYGLAVAAGRLPRYLLMVRLWQLAATPVWIGLAGVGLILWGGSRLWTLHSRP
jgi:hypothetical protein